MDGYTAFGASITYNGSKQTFLCPAPTAVIADLDVVSAAPPHMNAWGYADLVAKFTAGADWLLADALGVEPLHPQAWHVAQSRLRELVSQPEGVRAGSVQSLQLLLEGLMLGGFAMQAAKSSRAASGAEHQFSHLWDMQHHTFNGKAPSHGFKVGIGTLAASALYEQILAHPLEKLDVNDCCSNWPDEASRERMARELFQEPELITVALNESRAKSVDTAALRAQLSDLRKIWPNLRDKLRQQLLPFPEIKQMLQAAGAPVEPEQIGISRERLRESFRAAWFIRRRFTILDLVVRAGLLDACLDKIFGAKGQWPIETGKVANDRARAGARLNPAH
jgi:glycerol-1-phosphate dehydrogenase [NAD(P)+]